MKFKNKILYMTAIALLTACVPPQKNSTPTVKTEPAQDITAYVVEITPLKQTQLSQKKSNVTVRIEPINDYSFHWEYEHTYIQKPDEIKLFSLRIEDGKKDYIHKAIPSLIRDNPFVRFKITISNQSDKVIRPAGSVLTIDIDGKNVPINTANISDYLNAIIVPNSSKEMIISPFYMAALVHKSGTIRIGLYELKVGDKLETFEWYYSFKTVMKKIKGEPTIISEERKYPFNVRAYGQKTKGPKATIIQ